MLQAGVDAQFKARLNVAPFDLVQVGIMYDVRAVMEGLAFRRAGEVLMRDELPRAIWDQHQAMLDAASRALVFRAREQRRHFVARKRAGQVPAP